MFGFDHGRRHEFPFTRVRGANGSRSITVRNSRDADVPPMLAIYLHHIRRGIDPGVDPRTVARVVRCSVRNTLARSQPQRPVVFAFSSSGRCVLSLYAERWSQDDLDRIWRHLGVVPEGTWNDVIADINLKNRFPSAF